MNNIFLRPMLTLLAAMALTAAVFSSEGVIQNAENREAKMLFDMRDNAPGIAALHMQLMLETHEQLRAMGRDPDFKIVFIAHVVKFLSSDRSGFSLEDGKHLEDIDNTISKMVESGIELEICRKAVDFFNVDPATIRSEIKEVKNGWTSLLDYQEDGYKLIPVY